MSKVFDRVIDPGGLFSDKGKKQRKAAKRERQRLEAEEAERKRVEDFVSEARSKQSKSLLGGIAGSTQASILG